jgi:lysyl-tRNA synthetase class 2
MTTNSHASAALRRLENLRGTLEFRHRVLNAIRCFFNQRGFVEVETPVRVRTPAPELHIEAEPSGDHYLRTSPELHMKKLLAAGIPRIFQMGPCFRLGERGRLHNPEYTMLEWYRTHADYADMLADTKTLIAHLVENVLDSPKISYGGATIELLPFWERLTVSEAFLLHAGWDPCRHYDPDRFDLDLVDKVEPALPRHVPVVLTDYPVQAAALARIRAGDPPVAERWELYIAGVEIANAYSELTDPQEQRRRFEDVREAQRRRGQEPYPLDEEFLAMLAAMPPAGGVALGVDRLVMLLSGAATLDDVLPFRD